MLRKAINPNQAVLTLMSQKLPDRFAQITETPSLLLINIVYFYSNFLIIYPGKFWKSTCLPSKRLLISLKNVDRCLSDLKK